MHMSWVTPHKFQLHGKLKKKKKTTLYFLNLSRALPRFASQIACFCDPGHYTSATWQDHMVSIRHHPSVFGEAELCSLTY